MSLWGDWTKTPGRPAGRLPPPPPLAARPDRGRDNVPLLYFFAVDGRADHAADGLVGIDGDDPDFAEEFGLGLDPVEEQLMAGDQAVVRADRDLDRSVVGLHPGDLPLHAGRTLEALDGGDVIG